MDKLTAEDVAKMDVTERLDCIAKLSPEMARIVETSRQNGMSDPAIFECFREARAGKSS